MKIEFIFVGLIVIFQQIISPVIGSSDEYRLLQDLRQNYDSTERPVANDSDTVRVKLRVLLQQLLDVDERNQVISLVLWTQYTWNDYKLHWNPNEYGGIRDVRFPADSHALWKPDILLFNSADEKFDASFPVNFVVSHTGNVLLAPPGIVKCSCKIDITWFPFDEQMCHLKYGSWTYSATKLELFIDNDGLNETHQIDLKYYVRNGEWNLIATPAHRLEQIFQNEPYNEVYFYLRIRRRTLYYGLNWVIPSVLISLMTVLGFTLPPEAGEKITLGKFEDLIHREIFVMTNRSGYDKITILLSVCLFLDMVADVTPPTSEAVPIIGNIFISAFFSCCMLVVSASVVVTVLVLNLHWRGPETHRMSPLVSLILLDWLPWLLFMSRPGHLFRKPFTPNVVTSSLQSRKVANARLAYNDSTSLLRYTASPCTTNNRIINEINLETNEKSIIDSKNLTSALHDELQPIVNCLDQINASLTFIIGRMHDDDDRVNGEADWKFAAMVIDRFCLFLFTIFIVISSFSILVFAAGDF